MSQTDQTDAPNKEPILFEEKQPGPKKLDYHLENGFRHVFQILDFNKTGAVNKSSLQVICANVCRVLDILYMPEHLEVFKGESKKLDEDGFVEYVRQLVRKAIGLFVSLPFLNLILS